MMLAMCWPVPAMAKIGEQRDWTDSQGRKLEARLMKIETDAVILKIGIKEHRLALDDLSKADQAYVNDLRPKPPLGEISEFTITQSESGDLGGWLESHHMRSLQWKGKPRKHADEFTLPFQLHVPPDTADNSDELLPLLVHLHGTGGIGSDNLKQFSDGGGVVKSFVGKELQGYQKTYIMIPQTARMSGWYALSFTDPSYELRAIVHAIRILAETPGYRVDLSRIYVTGLSMGGAGAFQAMAKFPGFFAAAIPIAYVDTTKIFNEGNVGPIWVAINRGDRNYEDRLQKFRRHYLAMGGKIRTTEFDKGGHDAWTNLLGNAKFRNWLFRRQLDEK